MQESNSLKDVFEMGLRDRLVSREGYTLISFDKGELFQVVSSLSDNPSLEHQMLVRSDNQSSISENEFYLPKLPTIKEFIRFDKGFYVIMDKNSVLHGDEQAVLDAIHEMSISLKGLMDEK